MASSRDSIVPDDRADSNTSCEIDYHELDIGERIGSGSFSVVHIGKWGELQVAIKIIETSPISVCQNEKDILQKLNAPTIITFYGFTRHDDKYFIVTEYMPQGSLTDYLESGLPLIMRNNYKILYDVATGLDYLHQLGIVHRDVRSDNIFLNSSSGEIQAKLGDFGFAKEVDAKVEPNIGSRYWLAPELAEQPHSDKSDIFSLAIVMLEIVTCDKFYRILDIIASSYYDLVKEGRRCGIPESCPPKVAKLITWGWQQKPEDRPTAKEISRELSTYDIISEELSSLQFEQPPLLKLPGGSL